MAELNWSDAQWQRVNDAVLDSFQKASVASEALPTYGPLAAATEIVRNERLLSSPSGPPTISLDTDHDGVNLRLVNLTVRVELTSEQVADEALSNALLAFRRAANILALEEDQIVFDGYRAGPGSSRFVANGVGPQRGLADPRARYGFASILPRNATDLGLVGMNIVSQIVVAIGELERSSNPGPFTCVLGDELFNSVHTPTPSLVLPADRIIPQLKGGRLLRSGRMQTRTGIIISLANNAVDVVVGMPPTVQFLNRTSEAKYLFRVYERFVMRIRDEYTLPVAGFRFDPTGDERRDELGILSASAERDRQRASALAELSKLRAKIEV